MPIEFHCNFCGRLVRAPDEAGGKKGKCPACQNLLYVPMPEGAVEEFDLAPVDEQEERRRRQMEEQARAAERQLLKEKQLAAEGATPGRPPREVAEPAADTSGPEHAEDIEFEVVTWIRSMADGNLGSADRAIMQLQKNPSAAKQAIQKLSQATSLPTDLRDVPRPVLSRYLKMLRDQL